MGVFEKLKDGLTDLVWEKDPNSVPAATTAPKPETKIEQNSSSGLILPKDDEIVNGRIKEFEKQISDFISEQIPKILPTFSDFIDVVNSLTSTGIDYNTAILAATKVFDKKNISRKEIKKLFVDIKPTINKIIADFYQGTPLSLQNDISSLSINDSKLTDEISKYRKILEEKEAELTKIKSLIAEKESDLKSYETACTSAVNPFIKTFDKIGTMIPVEEATSNV